MKVFKIEIMVINFDQLSEKEVKSVIENTKYPNRCIYPKVKSIKSVDVDWDDDHPLNKHTTSDQAFIDLFSITQP